MPKRETSVATVLPALLSLSSAMLSRDAVELAEVGALLATKRATAKLSGLGPASVLPATTILPSASIAAADAMLLDAALPRSVMATPLVPNAASGVPLA